MARSSVRIPNELLIDEDEMEEHNKLWLGRFRKERKLGTSYINLLSKFLRLNEFGNKPFNKFDEEDVLRFIDVMLENNYQRRTTKALVSIVGSFKSYLFDKYPKVFEENFLSNLSVLRDSKVECIIQL